MLASPEVSDLDKLIGVVNFIPEPRQAPAPIAEFASLLKIDVESRPYRWIRHPVYAFWLPVTVGPGAATRNWFIIVSRAGLILILAVIRVPREEGMMLEGFGESYRRYMTRTGRFIPRWRVVQAK